jgi:hypothetical protein
MSRPAGQWQVEARRRLQLGHRALAGIDDRWSRLGNDKMRLVYLDNIERCYAEDPVAFAHFEPLILELVTAKMSST